MSAPIQCPSCGAPPPASFVVPPGQFSYRCVYCNQSSVLGAPAPTPSQQGPMTGPIFIVLPSGHDDDDDDHVPHHHYHAPTVVARPGISWIVWLIVVVVVSLGGTGAGFMRCTRHSTLASSFIWNGSEPLVCGGNENISVSGVTANFNAGAAIHASGNCHVRCTDCNLTAPTAIEASGNADVTIVNGTVKGNPTLADASNNARVTITGNVVTAGATKQSSNAKVSAPAQAASNTAAKAPPPAAQAAAPAPAPTTAGAKPVVPAAKTTPAKKK